MAYTWHLNILEQKGASGKVIWLTTGHWKFLNKYTFRERAINWIKSGHYFKTGESDRYFLYIINCDANLKKKQEFSIASINLFEIIPRKNYAKLTIFRRDPLLQEWLLLELLSLINLYRH